MKIYRFGRKLKFFFDDLFASTRLIFSILIRPSSVVICEPNSCHGEVVAGIVSLIDDVMLVPALAVVERSHKYQYSDLYNQSSIAAFYISYEFIKLLLPKVCLISKIRLVLSSTHEYWRNTIVFDSWLPLDDIRCKFIAIQHDLSQVNNSLALSKLAQRGQLCSLSAASSCSRLNSLPITLSQKVGHSYYLSKSRNSSSFTEKYDFAVIGSGGQDLGLIEMALRDICKSNSYVKVCIVGNFIDKIALKRLQNIKTACVEQLAGKRVSFTDITHVLNASRFILGPLLVSDYAPLKKVSGSLQLSRAFRIPIVLHETLATEWGVDPSACIRFNHEDLKSGMRTALKMNENSYKHMLEAIDLQVAHDIDISRTFLCTFLR